jgi:hypothetical protein
MRYLPKPCALLSIKKIPWMAWGFPFLSAFVFPFRPSGLRQPTQSTCQERLSRDWHNIISIENMFWGHAVAQLIEALC